MEPADLQQATSSSGGTYRLNRLNSIRQLLHMFRMERITYLVVTLFSVAVLLTCAVTLMQKKDTPWTEIIGLFGSSGTITYSTTRLLRMWSDALRLLDSQWNEKPE